MYFLLFTGYNICFYTWTPMGVHSTRHDVYTLCAVSAYRRPLYFRRRIVAVCALALRPTPQAHERYKYVPFSPLYF